jgi:hypothetical protein
MKTPNKQRKFILNKFPFYSSKKLSLNKPKKSLDLSSSVYDELELKDKRIKNSDRQIKKIKIESIKQFVYANKKIPERWKTKQDYQTQVLKIFAKDPKFLNYVGNNSDNNNNNNNISKSIQSFRNNLTTTSCFKSSLNKFDNNINESNKEKSLSILSDNGKKQRTNIAKKYCYTTPVKKRYTSLKNTFLNDKEMIYILDDLQRKFPIKEKLNELYPKEELERIGIKSHTVKKRENRVLNIRYPFLPSRKMKTFLKKNIYINLIPSNKDSEKTKEEDFENLEIFKKTINDDIENDVSKMKKEMIKNPLVKKHLESINYYGPYYSYCSCGNKNLSFYQKLSLNQMTNITNYIHQYREKIYK